MADSIAAKGTGPTQVYAASPDVVYKDMPRVLHDVGLTLVTIDKQKGLVLAQRGMSAFSFGEDVAIFVTPLKRGNDTQVEVDSKRALATNIFAPNWSKVILARLNQSIPSVSSMPAQPQ
ncbi:MAG: hypothetical protein KGL42_08180 [Betaproteobacteria bacterium]|nr:hypothetical protein [Betaproteobacteria bacterium]